MRSSCFQFSRVHILAQIMFDVSVAHPGGHLNRMERTAMPAQQARPRAGRRGWAAPLFGDRTGYGGPVRRSRADPGGLKVAIRFLEVFGNQVLEGVRARAR
jgi:hypothetical protein